MEIIRKIQSSLNYLEVEFIHNKKTRNYFPSIKRSIRFDKFHILCLLFVTTLPKSLSFASYDLFKISFGAFFELMKFNFSMTSRHIIIFCYA